MKFQQETLTHKHHMEAPVDTPYTHSLLKDRGQYEEMYTRSIEQPAQFWGEVARQFHWETPVRFSYKCFPFCSVALLPGAWR